MLSLKPKRLQQIEDTAFEIWRDLGGRVLPAKTAEILTKLSINVLEYSLGGNAAAELNLERRLLFVEPKHPWEAYHTYWHRRRFTEAHEIGHVVLHTNDLVFHRDGDRTEMREAISNNDSDFVATEVEADAFAGALLMPESELIKDLQFLPSEGSRWWRNVAREYMVSWSALQVRVTRIRPELIVSGSLSKRTGQITFAVPSKMLEAFDSQFAECVWRSNYVNNASVPHRFLRQIAANEPEAERGVFSLDLASIFPCKTSRDGVLTLFGSLKPELLNFEAKIKES